MLGLGAPVVGQQNAAPPWWTDDQGFGRIEQSCLLGLGLERSILSR